MLPSRSRKKLDQNSEEALMKLTKKALLDVLGRQPTKQEVLRCHVGFKRMAFVMMEHLDRAKIEKK